MSLKASTVDNKLPLYVTSGAGQLLGSVVVEASVVVVVVIVVVVIVVIV